MNYRIEMTKPSDFFPATVAQQTNLVLQTVENMSVSEIEWLSENRDFSEIERYKVKDEVDNSLLASSFVSEERRTIEQLFTGRDAVSAGDDYLKLLSVNLKTLYQTYAIAMIKQSKRDDEFDYGFWKSAASIADIDNAHAMYLSSHNWEFSVFDALIDELTSLVGSDGKSLAILLMAGVQDPRTSIYQAFGDTYTNLNRYDFVTQLRQRRDWMRPDGIMPMFAFKAATENAANHVSSVTTRNFTSQFESAVQTVLSKLSDSGKSRFISVCQIYQKLYAARAAYDIFEYFGFYAFARHFLIKHGMNALERSNVTKAKEFHYSASTYQFVELSKLLNLELAEVN